MTLFFITLQQRDGREASHIGAPLEEEHWSPGTPLEWNARGTAVMDVRPSSGGSAGKIHAISARI